MQSIIPIERAGGVALMTTGEAYAYEAEIIGTGARLRALVYDFDTRKGWAALGHSSYSAWVNAVASKFGYDPSRLFQELTAARIEHVLTIVSTEDAPIPESHLRPLARLSPIEQPGAWRRAHEIAADEGASLKAKHVERAVEEIAPRIVHVAPTSENRGLIGDGLDDVWDPPMEPGQAADYDSNEWYTPKEFVEAARTVMGYIHLDPASCDLAQEVIRAESFYTKEQDGLAQEWGGNIWLNPPYGDPLPWIEKLIAEQMSGRLHQAILLINTANSPMWSRALWHSDYAVCLLDRRVRFWRPDRAEAKGTAQDQMVWYVGDNADRFREVFGPFGAVR